MSRRFTSIAAVLTLALTTAFVAGCGTDEPLAPTSARSDLQGAPAVINPGMHPWGSMVIANRASGSISVLNARDGSLVDTFDLPAAANPPEPMYVVYVKRTGAVLVGDRANDRVVEFDANDFSVRRTAPTGAGVFHMWVDPVLNRQLWVNNDVDNTTTVIDPISFDVVTTVPMPADLVALGGKPHDVILDPKGQGAFVTMLNVAGPNDYVVKFDTTTFDEVARAPVGKDPHVSLTPRNPYLYVPCQGGNTVIVLDRATLAPVTDLDIPGAHGAGMMHSGRTFYVTNISGGGTDGLFAIDTDTNTVIGDPVDTPFAVPHNLALTTNGQRLFVTHSGATSDKVSFYALSDAQRQPVLLGDATVGLNPFGLAYVP